MTGARRPVDLDAFIDRRAVPALKVHPMVLGEGGEALFAAGVADMDFRAPPVVLDALNRRLEHGVFGYEALPGGLYGALAGWMARRHGWEMDETHVLRAPNILNSLAMVVSLFTGEGDGVIVQPPVFFDFFDILRENRRRAVANPLVLEDGRYRMDFDDLEEKAADPRTGMLILCNPHNPVGRVWRRAELMRLGDICARHEVLVVSDEIHGDITFPGHDYTPFAALGAEYARNSITCLSPAKSFNIAACCSAFTIIADERKRKALAAENSRLTVNKNNAFASCAMQAAYGGADEWLDDVLAYLAGNVALVRSYTDRIGGAGLIEPEGTFLLWLDFRALGLEPGALKPFLRQVAGWAVTDGRSFGEGGAGFVRFNIASPRPQLQQALDRFEAGMRDRGL